MCKKVRNINMKEDLVLFAADKDLPFRVTMCGISYCDEKYKIFRRKSEENVIEYIISGTGTVHSGDDVFNPCKGDVYLLRRGERHLYYSDKDNPWTKVWMNFNGDLADRIIESYGLTGAICLHIPQLKERFLDMYKTATSTIGTNAICDKAAVFFLKTAQNLAKSIRKEAPDNVGAASEIKAFIDDDAAFSLTLGEIADKMSYSKNHVIRVFKNEYGITPYEYMLDRRFEVAESLLKNTAYSVAQISEKLGFCDPKYFSGCFSKRYGFSPLAFRKIKN